MSTASFRDPSGRVFLHGEQIYRAINNAGTNDFNTALDSAVLKGFVNSGNLVKTSIVEQKETVTILDEIKNSAKIECGVVSILAKHETVPFQNFPYEWTPEMLCAAAELTLDFQERLLKEGMGLKDATPYNILFRGHQPVFVDWLSFEKRDPSDSVWLAQAQFIRTFILPLLVNKNFGLSLAQIFLSNRDGLEPEAVYQMCGAMRKFTSPFLTMVTIPKMLGANKKSGNTSLYEKHHSGDPEKARFILGRQIKYLRKLLEKVRPNDERTSDWAEYLGPNQHFTDKYLKTKHEFVETVLKEFSPATVLDIGCNTGYFSRIAAQNGAKVVAIDLDPTSVGRVWKMASAEKLDILPLVLDISRPSPGIGWRNGECTSFINRIKSKMDAVIMLAVIHHLLVTERIPLDEIISLIAETTKNILVLEFVPPDDPMFRQITRGRDHLFEYLTKEVFENACSKHFQILRSEKLADSNRELYLLKK